MTTTDTAQITSAPALDVAAPAGTVSVGQWHHLDDPDGGERLFYIASRGLARACGVQNANGTFGDIEVVLGGGADGCLDLDVAAARRLLVDLNAVVRAVDGFDSLHQPAPHAHLAGDEPILVDGSRVSMGDPNTVDLGPIFAAIENRD